MQFESYNNLYGNPEIVNEKTIEKNYGRIEEREYFLSYNISRIKDKEKWETTNEIAYTKVSKTYNNETITTENYYIIDYEMSMEKLIEAIRDHWNIECGLHWKLGVILDEDHSRNRVKNSINNLSIMRKIVFNLASLNNGFGKVPLQRKLTKYMLDFSNMKKLIFEIIPSIS